MNKATALVSAASLLAAATPAVGDQNDGANNTPVDPFADLPTVRLNEAEVVDMSGLAVSAPRKYEKVSTAAIAAKLPIKSGWKHRDAMFVPGTTVKEGRPGSVFSTITDIVKRAGRSGIASYELATQLRQAQIGNKRSHYCTELPPVGWAEGYIDSAVTQGLIGIHASKKAPSLFAPVQEAPATDKTKSA